MSEEVEVFKAMKEIGMAKRQSNKEKSTELLKEHGIEFESRNDGVHLMITTTKGRVNFYPSTGLYNGALSGRGVFNLIDELKGFKK